MPRHSLLFFLLVCSLVILAGCTGTPPGNPPAVSPSQVHTIPSEPPPTTVPTPVPTTAGPRTITFSGHDWEVKTANSPAGPGPNIFSDKTGNVWVDERGRLHMKITKTGSRWECAEIISEENFGYGEYAFTLASDPGILDKNVVLGLFTWDDDPAYHYREIDIEFSRWENERNSNAQYVLQPWDFPDHTYRFDLNAGENVTTHTLRWEPGRIAFRSYYGPWSASPASSDIIRSWVYTGDDVPLPGNENARINLWLIWGKPPSDGKETEVVVREFRFVP